jgi:hypothetical protein
MTTPLDTREALRRLAVLVTKVTEGTAPIDLDEMHREAVDIADELDAEAPAQSTFADCDKCGARYERIYQRICLPAASVDPALVDAAALAEGLVEVLATERDSLRARVAELETQLDEARHRWRDWQAKYTRVADAIAPSSLGPSDLVSKVHALRDENERLRKDLATSRAEWASVNNEWARRLSKAEAVLRRHVDSDSQAQSYFAKPAVSGEETKP